MKGRRSSKATMLARIDRARRDRAAVLDLSGLNLAYVPESIGELQQLQHLNLSENRLTTLPQLIGQLQQLKKLNLSGNQLTTLPESIGQLYQLKNLDLSGSQLVTLPDSVGQLHQLQSLNLITNQLTTLPESIGQLRQLKSLILSGNQLMTLPDSIGQLQQLECLDLVDTGLTTLPKFFDELQQLQSLNLTANQLTTLPDSIGELQLLQSLNLSENRLTTLPDSIGQLQQLRKLNLKRNELRALPKSMRQLVALSELQLHGNPNLGLPAELVGPFLNVSDRNFNPRKPSDILDYYFRLRDEKRPLNEAKLILVGRGTVGKTSLVNRLVHNKFEQNEKKTEGIQVTQWSIRLDAKEDVRLNIWDFGGQEILHATHQFFLTHRSLYLLVLNGREGGEEADADYWLKLIESFGGESPVIVVLNKIKEHAFDLNRRALRQKYPGIREFIKSDCEDATGIGDLHNAIERETDRLEHLRDAFPVSWFCIKDRLAGMEKNYVTFDDFRKLCTEENETDRSAQESLAFCLHHLGIVLNFKDDPRLQDTHVLNPHWVTRGIYKILNAERLEQQKGEIGLSDLSGILDDAEYPRAMHRFIFDLMKKFELCFGFPDDDARYLIPELLDKQEPMETAEFDPAACLNFEYYYPVLLEGLLPRFIVRTSSLSEGLKRWRTGVILRFEGCQALVRAGVQDRKVFIHVKGPAMSRRRLLAIIRSDFERIHRDIRKLEPQEMVPVPDHSGLVVSYKKLLIMEQRGVRQFTEVAGDDVIDLNVQKLLNGVDLEGTRRMEREFDLKSEAVQLFVSYSHKDESLRNELEMHLKLMQRQGLIDRWHDRLIEAGGEWKEKIDENLESAQIILLLVSSDFIASDYCYEKEMGRALERHGEGKACVIPVVVRDVNWARAPFAKLQALPKDGLAVTKWQDKDSAWRNVSEGIEKVAEEIRRRPR